MNVKDPKLERPHIDFGVSMEEWNVFTRRWRLFKVNFGISDESAPSQHFKSISEELGDNLQKFDAEIATGVLRTELMQMCQMRGKCFRLFAARVRGKAYTCVFSADCSCLKVNYTDQMILDTLLNGISVFDIRRESWELQMFLLWLRGKKWHEMRYPPLMYLLPPLLGARKRSLSAKTVAHLHVILLQLTGRSNLPVLFVRNSSTCIEKALVCGTTNRTRYSWIASAHVASPSMAIFRHLHQLPSQTLVKCLKAQAI